MRVLSVVHEESGGASRFGEVVAERGHELVEWRVDLEPHPEGPFHALMVFGGNMNTHEEDDYPWLRAEHEEIRRYLAAGVPVLGVCLGGQLLAKALGARVSPAPQPEVGWYEIEKLPQADGDPLFARLPERFPSLQWHEYRFDLPDGAAPLARSPVCLQAYRHGERAWGLQFHPEVSRELLQEWIDLARAAGAPIDFARFEADSDRHIAEWNRIGRLLCEGFLEAAESAARAPAA